MLFVLCKIDCWRFLAIQLRKIQTYDSSDSYVIMNSSGTQRRSARINARHMVVFAPLIDKISTIITQIENTKPNTVPWLLKYQELFATTNSKEGQKFMIAFPQFRSVVIAKARELSSNPIIGTNTPVNNLVRITLHRTSSLPF